MNASDNCEAGRDLQGRSYARLSQLKVGDCVQIDGDFTCLPPWSTHFVQQNAEGLYILCDEGGHQLDSQICDDGTDYLVGVYKIDTGAGP